MVTALLTLALASITYKYVLLTQHLAIAAREQLRFQQHTERSDAAQLLTLVEVFLGNLARLPKASEDVEALRDVSIWRHNDVSTFGSLAAAVLGSTPAVHDAIQGLNAIRAKVDGARLDPADDRVAKSFSWTDWNEELDRTRRALRTVRDTAESADLTLSQREEPDGTVAVGIPSKPPPPGGSPSPFPSVTR